MTSNGRYGRSGRLILAAGFGLAFAAPAGAQIWPRDMKIDPPAAQAAPDTDGSDAEESDAETPAKDAASKDTVSKDTASKDTASKDADIKGLELDWSQLNVDASTLTWTPASKARAASAKSAAGTDASWSANDKANGSSAVSVKQSVSPFLDTRIGADMTVTRQPQTLTESQQLSAKLANGGSLPQSSGTAWAAITAPGAGSIWDKTAVEARVDPAQDQTKLGTSLSKSLPINQQYSVTLQNGYNLIEQGVIPVPGIIGRPTRNYETDQSAKLSIAGTGTSFTAGQSLSSSDDKWLRNVGAEQKLFGGVSISGSIGETPLGTMNKSISAGFKQSW